MAKKCGLTEAGDMSAPPVIGYLLGIDRAM